MLPAHRKKGAQFWLGVAMGWGGIITLTHHSVTLANLPRYKDLDFGQLPTRIPAADGVAFQARTAMVKGPYARADITQSSLHFHSIKDLSKAR